MMKSIKLALTIIENNKKLSYDISLFESSSDQLHHIESRITCQKRLQMDQVQEFAKQLVEAKREQKEFKKRNKDVFDENREHNKSVAEAKRNLVDAMTSLGETSIVVDGVEFEVKTRKVAKHSDEVLRTVFPSASQEQLDEYIASITSDTIDVASRKKRRTG